MQIDDGTGTGRKAKVNLDNYLHVSAVSESRICHNSEKHSNSYSWTAVSADIDAGDTALYLVNDSTTKNLCITKIYMWADVSTQFKIHCPAYVLPAGGSLVTGNNLNRTSPKAAESTARADETANVFAAGNVVQTVRNNEVGSDQFGVEVSFEGALILGYHQSVAVDIIAEPAAFECTIFGYFEDF